MTSEGGGEHSGSGGRSGRGEQASAGDTPPGDYYRELLSSVDVIVWEADAKTWRFTFVSPWAQELLGYPIEWWLREEDFWTRIIHEDDRERAVQSCLAVIGEGRGRGQFEYRVVAADGRVLWLRDIVHVVLNGQGKPHLLRGVMIDITERKQAEATLEHRALHDPLTGLPNRTLLFDRLNQAILLARRGSEQLALLVIDLDRFKEVNDTLGHAGGDLVLSNVGGRLRAAVRASDTIARLGGDEFAVVLPGAPIEAGVRLARKLIDLLREPVVVSGQSFVLGASIGIAAYPQHGEAADALLGHADTAMYVAKRRGGGYVLYGSEPS